MPRTGRGGRRRGAPGVAYPQRSDLQQGPRAQPIRVASGQPYGQRKAQEDAQRAIPLPDFTPAGAHGSPYRPTDRPDEPVTAGLPMGPGPGPEILTPMPLRTSDEPPTLELLQLMMRQSPSNELRSLIEEAEYGGYA